MRLLYCWMINVDVVFFFLRFLGVGGVGIRHCFSKLGLGFTGALNGPLLVCN